MKKKGPDETIVNPLTRRIIWKWRPDEICSSDQSNRPENTALAGGGTLNNVPPRSSPALERLSRLLSSRFEQRRADSRGLPQRRGNQRLRPLVRGHGGSTVI